MSFNDYVVQNYYCPHSRQLSRAYQEEFYRLFGEGITLDIECTTLEATFVPSWVAGDIIQFFARQGLVLEPVHRYAPIYGRKQFYISGFRPKTR